MHRFLMVPIQLDALHLSEPLTVAGPLADFSRLPYFDGKGDVNADTAYISKDLVSQPFEKNRTLEVGVHLHWALPDSLTRSHPSQTYQGKSDSESTDITFPVVPTRWLITRSIDGQPDKRWFVASDYLYPVAEADRGYASGSPTFPVIWNHDECDSASPELYAPPFRYLGRSWPLNDWLGRKPPNDSYWDGLTAIGYGEPTFAAFYPNCRNVFGFYDPAPKPGAIYTIVGWYRRDGDDVCSSGRSLEELKKEYRWEVAGKDLPPDLLSAQRPDRLLCYARIKIGGEAHLPNPDRNKPLQVAVGNTATEALSAFLAHENAQPDAKKIRILEDQIESLHLAPGLEHRSVDVGPKFKEARHDKSFSPVTGGTIWTVRRVQEASTGKSDAANTQPQVTLPEELAHRLNQLNVLQQNIDGACFEVESWRERIFADWYKYMVKAYLPDDRRHEYPPTADEMKYFIEQHGLKPLEEAEQRLRELEADGQKKHDQLKHQLADLQLISLEDVADWDSTAFAAAEKILSLEPNPQQSDQQRDYIVIAINDLIDSPDLHLQPGRLNFPKDRIPPEAAAIIAKHKDKSSWPREDSTRYNRLLLQSHLPALPRRAAHALQRIAGPRYWQPNEPVVLLTGAAAKPSKWHGRDGTLKCRIHDFSQGDFARLDDKSALTEIDTAVEQALEHSLPSTGAPICEHQPWSPFLLEWEVGFGPVSGRESNRHPADRRYKKDYVTTNFELPENAIELRLRGETDQLSEQLVTHPSTYQGRSLLTPGAQVVLLHQIDEFLEKRLLPDYYSAEEINNAERIKGYFDQHKDKVISWYRSLPEKESDAKLKQDAFVDQVLKIHDKVADQSASTSGFPALAQSLSGFNAAMLGHKQTMQLDIRDPLGFPEYQEFAKDVQHAVGKFNRVAPQPLNDFNPIRNGALRLNRLRLIDTFGQTRDLEKDLNNIIVTDAMFSRGDPKLITLPPRLVQPARLNFRWLSSRHGPGQDDRDRREDVEMNTHPATSPVCGWLVCNNLDSSLAVYESSGQALGYLDKNCHWQPARGSRSALDEPTRITNPHLYRVVRWMIAAGERNEKFLSDLVDTLDSALENSDPDNFAQHQDLALLMSRPLAVVRASLSLEQKGLPAVNNEWYTYSDVLASGRYETDNVRAVDFKVRLGEHRQLNDGLAGYWVEDKDGSLSPPTFFSPQGDTGDSSEPASPLPAILTHGAGHVEQFQLDLSLQSQPQLLTMLVDPHGKVHATSGILPTKAIDIPPDQFAPALAAMEVSFLSTPILTQRREAAGAPLGGQNQKTVLVDLPLPEEAGYEWSWVEPAGMGTHKTHQIGNVDRRANFQGQQVLREGWLLLSPANKQSASGVPKRPDTGDTSKNC